MPLAPMALAFADEQDGEFGRRARDLAERLKSGVSLNDAIAESGRALPPEAAMAARVASESGDLAGAFEATSFGSRFDRTLLRSVMSRLFYVLPATLVFIAFMKFKIQPSMVAIFSDFNEPLPPISRAVMGFPDPELMNFGGGGFSPIWLLIPQAITLMGLICVLLTVAMIVWSLVAWLQWRGWLGPALPGLRRIVKWVDMGVVLRVLALATRRNCPLPSMIHALALTHPKRTVRRRLRAVVTDINDGCSWQKSLELQRLIGKPELAILSAAQRSGNLSWALGQMADSFERKATFRLQAVAQVVLPLMLLPVGLVVCVLAAGYFAPLARLISNLS
jgi:type II secretory pathway component PulF